MPDQETQTQDTDPICDHEEEINCCVKKELDNLSRQLLEFNEKTFDSFMQEITKQLEEWVNANNKLYCEIDQQKIKLQEAEKKLTSLKRHPILKQYPTFSHICSKSELCRDKYIKVYPYMIGNNDNVPKNRNYGKRYILCDDLVIVVQHQDKVLWKTVQYFFEFIARDKNCPWYKNYLMTLSGRHERISSIYIVQRYFETHPNIHANLTYISLHRDCTLETIKQILKDMYDDYEFLAKKVYEVIKKHYVIIDIQRSANDLLSIHY
ncbi:hypothetical protein Glove_108g35 [Diversispora epigaea]|uniref:Uncharacterized protein n=1 Tax=Diversispora epigaea TaxID=1348612 RepID=A0A397JCA7_9GLOM|nr:hypothetical protein Glove_108g35 [Diversispora epigaea]